MVRQRGFHDWDSQAHRAQKLSRVLTVKDVVVYSAMLDIVQGPLLKVLPTASARVLAQVVFRKNFFQMRLIVFTNVVCIVVQHMLDRGDGTLMVECATGVREY